MWVNQVSELTVTRQGIVKFGDDFLEPRDALGAVVDRFGHWHTPS